MSVLALGRPAWASPGRGQPVRAVYTEPGQWAVTRATHPWEGGHPAALPTDSPEAPCSSQRETLGDVTSRYDAAG